MLLWAVIFLTWTPVYSLRLITGIVLVPLGLWLVARYILLRRRAESTEPATEPKP
ncbi:hypothetical protein GA0061083_2063 [Pseudarthrobacter enclensis]|nr:hypothetical protein GA0061083_2063 [Pseudarthrobacter enclensis]